ncbi:3-phosphoshikimate 1-carboxyvinyltransferase [Clostridium polyendosporum]|uniref:3-phosphoshikimate 1-carboxyvinyltransferase n=1 Tax=Clostridium polyendosporum TaxID=69208 RepID=A0A919S2R8_9CLOT|nr:3-phosphoshikimate 1-carboxyvinyltransferase [Clostridium polyendosporum]GIM29528.1 3-phosphoshikimate 1-carboxyvinyltransferase [Clostridium polyendosporum]
MKHVIINPNKLKGELTIPPSKSMSHRAVICAGLSEGVSNISNVMFSQDIDATCDAMRSLGVNVERNDDTLKIQGTSKIKVVNPTINCFESGSTIRFLIPIAATSGEQVIFEGKGKLVERPLKSYYDIFDLQKIDYKNVDGKLPLTINGKLKPGNFEIRGDVSSQFISGLLFALPLLDGDSKIIITTELESKPYVDLTLQMLNDFKVEVENHDYKEFAIKGNQKYIASDYKVEGDFSQVAFWLVAGLLGADIVCGGLKLDSLQGDKAILSIIEDMKGKLVIDGDKVQALPSKTKGAVIDASQCPDLVPVLTVLAALSEGTTEIINAARLRIKESDRLTAISTELKKLGADIEEKEDGLIIRGRDSLNGGEVHSWNDHRIAMAMAVASLKCNEPIIIKDADCVKKSYPHFWSDFKKLGGNINEWSLGK